jgi:hypothetical protein
MTDDDERADEIRFLRAMVDQLVSQYGVPWVDILTRTRRHNSAGRTNWRLTYIMALEEAAFAEQKPRKVLSELPLA